MQMSCPGCGSKDLRCSRNSGLLCSVLKRLELTPYRCRSCRKRFFRAGPAAARMRTPHRLRRFRFVPERARAHGAGR